MHRSDNTTFSEDDNVLVLGVSGERGGIGYFGYSYFSNNRDRLKAVPILNDAGEAVLPSLDSINSGAYNPLSRPLFIYVAVASLERPAVAAFVEYFITGGVFLVDSPEVGYVQLPQELYAAALQRVQQRIGGSAHGRRRRKASPSPRSTEPAEAVAETPCPSFPRRRDSSLPYLVRTGFPPSRE